MAHLIALLFCFSLVGAPQQDGRPVGSVDVDVPSEGVWVGGIEMDGESGDGSFMYLRVDDGGAFVTAPGVGVSFDTHAESRREGERLVLEVGGLRFGLTVDSDADRLSGDVVEDGGDRRGVVRCRRTVRPMDVESCRVFAGVAKHSSGLELELAVALARGPAGWVGSVDIPLRDVQGLPVVDVAVEPSEGGGSSVTARVPGGRPMQLVGSIDGDGERLTGELRQGALAFELDLRLDEHYGFRGVARPQHPEPPFPYRTRELVAEHPAGHVLAGTLTLPDPERHGPGPYATAVMITGGGQEDRDSTGLGHKPFLVIADHLTRAGLAVFRYDDRGVGESRVTPATPVGKDATSLLLATDTAAVVRRLRLEPELAPNRIGLIGHSEGGLIAPLVTLLEPDVAFVVILAGPGAPCSAVFRKQFELDWESAGANAATVASLSARLQLLQSAIVFGAPTERLLALERELADACVEAGVVGSGDPERGREEMLALFRQFDSPWWRFAFGYDPSPVLASVRCPLLALNGDKDRQVWHAQNLPVIERAIRGGGGDVTTICIENRNHLFQPTETGEPSEYASIEITFDEGVLDDIVEWLVAKRLL